MKKVLIVLFTLALVVGCKKEVKKESLSFAISGMTAENDCATNIQKKLTETDGILKAEVKLAENIGVVEYDSNVINKEAIYKVVSSLDKGKECCKASDIEKKACCKGKNKAACTDGDTKTACKEGCDKPCCAKDAKKTACKEGCDKPCCAKDAKKTACKEGCDKPCCAKDAKKTACKEGCEKPCCAKG